MLIKETTRGTLYLFLSSLAYDLFCYFKKKKEKERSNSLRARARKVQTVILKVSDNLKALN